MKVVTCSSYYGSGSSALTNLVSEYANVFNCGDFEFRFLHDIDGVSDLEFHLVECHNRHNSGHALKRFYKVSKFYSGFWFNSRYEPYFQNQYLKETQKYIENLVDFSYKGWWFFDLYDKGVFKYYRYQFFNHLYKKFRLKKTILSKEITFASHPTEDKFLGITKNYTHSLFKLANKENADILVLDQIFPSSNIDRFFRYVKDDVYVFVIDRDPRDIYISEQEIWHGSICPKDVNLFCKWFKYTREAGYKPDINKNIIHIKFEDFIFKYNDTKEKIEKILNLESKQQIRKFMYLNPKISVCNTRLWEKYKQYENEIKIIEKELSSYLYDFDSIDLSKVQGIEIKNKKSF